MRFQITRVSTQFKEEYEPFQEHPTLTSPTEGARFDGWCYTDYMNYNFKPPKIIRARSPRWSIELQDLDALVALCKRENTELIVDGDSITVYDGYIE